MLEVANTLRPTLILQTNIGKTTSQASRSWKMLHTHTHTRKYENVKNLFFKSDDSILNSAYYYIYLRKKKVIFFKVYVI